ncbi:hypothetical protein NDU88_005247 [Pleurodeles waltl]|uniref:Uncharacterized protein n=1 Tax=Pleurodeles waltl TaxID=8319 RepID=A0AAV7VIG3_PLEWA|nr:hypothetical protein NDU88_005247 [Pleurodeles waltl]
MAAGRKTCSSFMSTALPGCSHLLLLPDLDAFDRVFIDVFQLPRRAASASAGSRLTADYRHYWKEKKTWHNMDDVQFCLFGPSQMPAGRKTCSSFMSTALPGCNHLLLLPDLDAIDHVFIDVFQLPCRAASASTGARLRAGYRHYRKEKK